MQASSSEKNFSHGPFDSNAQAQSELALMRRVVLIHIPNVNTQTEPSLKLPILFKPIFKHVLCFGCTSLGFLYKVQKAHEQI
jgi:hypothetical protein